MADRKKKSDTASAVKNRRKTQRDQVENFITAASKTLKGLKNRQKECGLLKSVGGALYGEMDKLSKKAPAEQVTLLGLGEVNNFLAQVKTLGQDDVFVQRLKQFVSAGEHPENRDVVLVLKLALQGLERISDSLSPVIRSKGARLREAEAVLLGLDLYLEYGQIADDNAFEANDVEFPQEWKTYERKFDFARLDRTDIPSYFAEEGEEDDEDNDEEMDDDE